MRRAMYEVIAYDARMAINPPIVVGPEHPVDDWALRDLHRAVKTQRRVTREMQKATDQMIEKGTVK